MEYLLLKKLTKNHKQASSLLYFSQRGTHRKKGCKISCSPSETLWFNAIISQLKITNLQSSDTKTLKIKTHTLRCAKSHWWWSIVLESGEWPQDLL